MARSHCVLLGSWVLLCTLAGSASAEDAKTSKSQCTVRDSVESIRVVICPPGLSQEQLRLAGTEACGLRLMCNAWIWDAANRAPKSVPKKDSDISPTDAGNAVAVWDNSARSLMLIERVAK